MANMKVEISVKNIDLFKNLIELLEKYKDSLPIELKEQIKKLEKDKS